MAINAAKNGLKGPDDNVNQSSKVKLRSVAGYMVLPGIMPLIKSLALSGFGYIAFLIAVIYQSVRILPPNHPYANPNNIGRFGFKQVIAVAANNVKVDRQNIDQLVVFFAVLVGIALLVLQFFALIWIVLGTSTAIAGDANNIPIEGMFITSSPDNDIAFGMLRNVFGIPDLFGAHTPTPYQLALHEIFQFYNLAILIVAAVVFVYYILVVIGETATTGTPFGKRFANIYAPIRLVVAIGLLVPLNYGFNASQYLTFYAAKTGSSFATNGWVLFNRDLENPSGISEGVDGPIVTQVNENAAGNLVNRRLLVMPKAPGGISAVELISIIRTCREAYALQTGGAVQIEPYVMFGDDVAVLATVQSIRDFGTQTPNTDIRIVYGQLDNLHLEFEANVKPYCGEIRLPKQSVNIASMNVNASQFSQLYFNIINIFIWNHPSNVLVAERFSQASYDHGDPCSNAASIEAAGTMAAAASGATEATIAAARANAANAACEGTSVPPAIHKQTLVERYDSIAEYNVIRNVNRMRNLADLEIKAPILRLGWGGAGVWYNKIAQVNGAIMTGSMELPERVKYPLVMEEMLDQKAKSVNNITDCNRFEPNLAHNKAVLTTEAKIYYATTFNAVFKYWRCDKKELTSNFIVDAMSAVFGISGLFEMRKQENADLHPLSKLSALGKGMIESSVRNMGFALVGGAGGGLAQVINPQLGQAASAASGAFTSIATVGLSIGFILYYILPFMPFIYVFFAVGSWVKSIFEAMVGAPLWALAHMRIDGDGIPGKMAMNGYLLILEIAIRPVLTIFGLVGSMIIFISLVRILDAVFDLVVSNITGTKIADGAAGLELEMGRHVIDQFFFTILYTMVVYMMAVSSFKLINLIPNNILRWMGGSVSAFSDNQKDPTEGLAQYSAIGGNQISAQVGKGVTKVGEAGGGLAAVLGTK